MADSLIAGLFLLLAVVALLLAVLALRHRVAFRLGVRNAARARRRTAMLLMGLLIGTSIIAGSLVVGDTIDSLALHYTYLAVGHSDEAIGDQSASGNWQPFNYSVYGSVQSAAPGDHEISGVTPEIVGSVSILDRTTDIPQPSLNLIAVNGNQSAVLGSFVSDTGAVVQGPAPGEVILDDLAASEMNASAGDSVVLYGPNAQPVPMVVQAVVQDNERGAFPTGGVGNYGSAFIDLSAGQSLEAMPGSINFLVISIAGGESQQLAHSDAVSAFLNTTIASIPAAHGLAVDEILKNAVATEDTKGSGATTLFLVLGLFSIAAGALLVVGIFTLLAEERKGEMGVERALGLRREELVYSFLFEGTFYAAGSALAGTALGVAVGYGLTYAFGGLIRTAGISEAALLQSFTVTPEALVLSYVAGFLLTLVTVAVASRRASRLNIVRAIRDLPEPDPPRRTYTYLALFGAIAFVLGALLYAKTYQGTSAISDPVIGGALVLAGLALVAARFVRNRPVFSALGVALLIWGGYEPLRTWALGTSHGGGVYGVFVEGIMLVTGAVLIYAFNAATVAAALVRLAGGRRKRAPVALVGLSFPGRRPGRTTTTLAIFALVSFTLVIIAAVGSSLDASLSTLEREESGGYALVAFSSTSAPQLPAYVSGNATLSPDFAHVVPLSTGPINVSVNGSNLAPYSDSVYSAPTGEPAFSDFYSSNQYTYSATLNGMSASQVDQELSSDPGVAIVDQTYSTVPDNLATSVPAGHPQVNPGAGIELTNPLNGNTTFVTVIGVMTQDVLTGVFVNPAAAAKLGVTGAQIFLMGVAPGIADATAALAAKKAFFPYGLVVVNLENAIASSIATTEGEIELLQIFVGLGLVVGIAAMGIVAARAVAERRREIGMLRANGFTQGMIIRAFLLEYTFITVIGLAIGTALGLLAVWNLTHSAQATATGVTDFAVPWLNLVIILVVAYGLSMLAVTGPSRRAARLPPAVAVRSSE